MNWVLIGTLTIGMVNNGYLGLPVTSYNKALLNTSTFDDASFTTGRVLYISSSSGNDANTGASPGSAWRTLNKVASSILRPGDIVLLKRGDTWREQLTVPSSGSAGNVITFGAYGTGAAPIITGADSMSSFANGGINIWDKTGVTMQPKVVMIGATLPRAMAASRAACTTPGDWYWAANTLSVYATSDPSGTVEAGQRDYVAETNNKDHLVFNGLTFLLANTALTTRGGIYLHGTTITDFSLLNCTVSYSAGIGAYLGNNHDNLTIQNCTLAYNGMLGFFGDTSSAEISITGNTVSYNGWRSGTANGFSSGMRGLFTSGEISGNTFTANGILSGKTPGFQTEHGLYLRTAPSSTLTVHDNIFTSNSFGSGVKSQCSVTIYNNWFKGNGAALDAGANGANAATIIFHHNVVFGSNGYCGFSESKKGAGDLRLRVYNNTFYNNGGAFKGHFLIADNLTELDVRNNIMSATPSNRSGDLQSVQTGTFTFDYNDYYQSGSLVLRYNGADKTWAQWQALGFDTHGVNADPMMSNPAGGNFTLQSTSPCINAGTGVGLSVDFAERQVLIDAAPDIGAYEWYSYPRTSNFSLKPAQ